MDKKETMSGIQIEIIARIAHEVNRAWCEANGDYSQPIWSYSSKETKESTIAGVRFALENPDVTPEMQHEEGAKKLRSNGWTYGEQKSWLNKTHPCVIPYNELPWVRQAKDSLFRATVEMVKDILLKKDEATK